MIIRPTEKIFLLRFLKVSSTQALALSSSTLNGTFLESSTSMSLIEFYETYLQLTEYGL